MSDITNLFHTYDELKKHRAYLLAALCSERGDMAWKSRTFKDGTTYDGYFFVGMRMPDEGYIAYIMEEEYWDVFMDAAEYDHIPEPLLTESEDVLSRIKDYFIDWR